MTFNPYERAAYICGRIEYLTDTLGLGFAEAIGHIEREDGIDRAVIIDAYAGWDAFRVCLLGNVLNANAAAHARFASNGRLPQTIEDYLSAILLPLLEDRVTT